MLNAGVATMLVTVAAVGLRAAPTPAQAQLARGRSLWDQRLSTSAIAALEIAAGDRTTAAEADEMLGRLYTFKGWQQEGALPGWHDEPGCREKALDALRASVEIDPSRASAQDALRTATQFAAAEKVDPAPARPAVKEADAALDAQRSAGRDAPIDELERAIEARIHVQGDAAPYFTGSQILIDRAQYDRAIAWAERGATASDHFIDENVSAYQMSGKVQSQYARGRATSADLVGVALLFKKDYTGAAAKLEEAERLWQGLDFGNQLHLAELASARNDVAAARNHYLSALSLSGGSAPARQAATRTLAALPPATMDQAAFDLWLDAELDRRREARKATALKSLVDRPLPKLALRTLDGQAYDVATLHGKVVLLDFFASWCGICRQELPQLKASFAKYRSDSGVVFLLVSIDEDSKRLDRYLAEMKFPFPVVRADADQVQQAMGFDNIPSTYYVDSDGVVRYQIDGTESHGDSPARVSWFIDQLTHGRSSQQ
jgi:peroxiredoxin